MSALEVQVTLEVQVLNRKAEIIDAINDRNKVIFKMTKEESYKNKISHRIVHIMVHRGGKIYIPKRSLNVRYLPGYFCTSAGGHVQAGETSEEASLRELSEEIGLTGPLQHVEDFFFIHEFKVHVSLYLKEYNPEIDFIWFDPLEVDSGHFYSQEQLSQLDKSRFHPQLMPCIEKIRRFVK